MNEKMYDFEQNKRNNLIFYGIPSDSEETEETLAQNIQRIIKVEQSYCYPITII